MTANLKPFVISRVLDAPRDRVWQAWTEVERMEQWFSPKGFARIAAKMDFRVGGTYHYGMRAPNGQEMWGRFVFREIKKPERLVWVNSFSDKDGGLTVHPMNPLWPRQMLTTVTLEAQGTKTKLTIEWIPLDGSSESEQKTFDDGRQSMNMGWTGTLENLTAYLAK
ncbi:MAG TPA: SRPBCC domain-containing protein [Burkholderiales bacterium]